MAQDTTIRMLTARDLTKLLGSRSLAYRLFNTQGFPVIELGKRKFVREDSFDEWLRMNVGQCVQVGV